MASALKAFYQDPCPLSLPRTWIVAQVASRVGYPRCRLRFCKLVSGLRGVLIGVLQEITDLIKTEALVSALTFSLGIEGLGPGVNHWIHGVGLQKIYELGDWPEWSCETDQSYNLRCCCWARGEEAATLSTCPLLQV